MNGFRSYANEIRTFLPNIVKSPTLHAKWLNTLSYMENCGARKIAACEHPTLVKEEMLKHASEEFRHSHYLKRQIKKIWEEEIVDYSTHSILGGCASRQYLNSLDIQTCLFLNRKRGLSQKEIREAAYLLVTYAIELRAGELYPIYDEVLKKNKSKVAVKSIVLEEEEHLEEMREGLTKLENGFDYADYVCSIEAELCKAWLEAVEKECLKSQTGST